MLANRIIKPEIGDCEAGECNAVNVEVWKAHGNMKLCKPCLEKDLALVAAQAREHTQYFQKEEKEKIQLSSDIHNAETISIMNLRTAIQANPDVPEQDKDREFVALVREHIRTLDKAIFDLQNQRKAWLVTGQQVAAALRPDIQAEFGLFDVTYKPVSPPKGKPKTERAPRVNARSAAREAHDVAKKYPTLNEAVILFYMDKDKISAEAAAKKALASLD